MLLVMRYPSAILLLALICFGCQPVTAIVVVDRDYDWRNSYPRAAVAAQADSELSLTVRAQVFQSLTRLDYDNLGLLISEGEEQAILDAKRLELTAIFIVDARRFIKGTGEESAETIAPSSDDERDRRRDDPPPGGSGVKRWTFHVGVKLIDLKTDKVVYDVQYGYDSADRFINLDLCVGKILAPLAFRRERGNWQEYKKYE